jgi:hypothetical protein
MRKKLYLVHGEFQSTIQMLNFERKGKKILKKVEKIEKKHL